MDNFENFLYLTQILIACILQKRCLDQKLGQAESIGCAHTRFGDSRAGCHASHQDCSDRLPNQEQEKQLLKPTLTINIIFILQTNQYTTDGILLSQFT